MIYRVTARCRLTLRLEEYTDTSALESRLPAPTLDAPQAPARVPAPVAQPLDQVDVETQLASIQDTLTALERVRAELPAEEYESLRGQLLSDRQALLRGISASGENEAPPETVAGTPPDDRTVIFDLLPRSVSIERNGISTADTATVEVDFFDCPIDPRVVRAAHIEVIVGTVRAQDYEAGMERGERAPDGMPLSIVRRSGSGALSGATRFVGFVDDWASAWDDNGDRLTFECRDMSAPLRDQPLPAGLSIDMSLPLAEGIAGLLANFPSMRGASVVFAGAAGGSGPIPALSQSQRRAGRRGRRQSRPRAGGNMSLWDHIVDTCRALGFTPRARGFEVRIEEPGTLFTSTGIRRMVYGANLAGLEFSRRLQGTKVPTIEARAYDPDRGRTLWARYPVRPGERASGVMGTDSPPRALRANEVGPSGSTPDERILTVPVRGIVDLDRLAFVARQYFEEIGRQEIEGNFATSDASSYGIDALEADLLTLDAGDPVQVLVAARPEGDGSEDYGDQTTTIATLQSMSRRRRARFLAQVGYDDRVADRLAALQEEVGFQTVFRVVDVRISWDRDSAIKINVGFINYITIREEAAA